MYNTPSAQQFVTYGATQPQNVHRALADLCQQLTVPTINIEASELDHRIVKEKVLGTINHIIICIMCPSVCIIYLGKRWCQGSEEGKLVEAV